MRRIRKEFRPAEPALAAAWHETEQVEIRPSATRCLFAHQTSSRPAVMHRRKVGARGRRHEDHAPDAAARNGLGKTVEFGLERRQVYEGMAKEKVDTLFHSRTKPITPVISAG